jgi:hypothetical protein
MKNMIALLSSLLEIKRFELKKLAITKPRTSLSSIVWVSLFLTLAFASTGYPQPINILATQYTTTVWDEAGVPNPNGTFSRTQVSSAVPISDSLYDPVAGNSVANANAGLFGVSGFTYAFPASFPETGSTSISHSSSFAESDLWFSPLTSQTTTISIQISALASSFEGGGVSLLDVTSGNELWSYGFGSFMNVVGAPSDINYGTTLSFGSDLSTGTDTLMLDTDLSASDTYELSMLTGSNANNDLENESIQLLSGLELGLEPVPEPSTFALIGLGSLALAMARRNCSSSTVL